jgi:putative transposase
MLLCIYNNKAATTDDITSDEYNPTTTKTGEGHMTLFKRKFRIETTRLKYWDYRTAGWYFVTICTHDKVCTLGKIKNDEMLLSDIGEIAEQFWLQIPEHFPQVTLDQYVIMPNHVHGIIVIQSENPAVDSKNSDNRDVAFRSRDVACNVSTTISRTMAGISPKKGSLSVMVRSYKSAVTRWARNNQYAHFGWQARFYDHIIRDEASLQRIQAYIVNNPAKWGLDRFNPQQQIK